VKKNDEKWALFWCSLLHPVIFDEIEKGGIRRYLTGLCEKEYVFPDGRRKNPGLSTLKRKLKQYRGGGFKNLARKIRSDQGKHRTLSQEIIDKAITLKKEQPFRSDDTINRFLNAEYSSTIPKSTLYRILKNAGATKLKLGVTNKKVRKRWSKDHTHDLWVGDFEEGPYVLVDGEVRATYLSLFIDCHSRYVVEGRYYLRQSLDILIDSLLRAWGVHGTSKGLYVDNAKIYHSNALKAACYALSIKLLHRPPGDPQPGGLVERIFGTVQTQFESEVRSGDIVTLDTLNRTFSAYLEVVYHPRVHSDTGQPPKERYDQGLTIIRQVDMDEAIRYFMKQEIRSVDKDFSDVRLDNRFYKVDPRLRRDKVEIRYDPFSTMEKVWIYSLHGVYQGEGVLHHRQEGAEITGNPSRGKPKNNYLDLIMREHEKSLQSHTRGIDYRKVIEKRAWPFPSFIQKLAHLMGRKGGMGAFTAEELETIKKTYTRIPELNEKILVDAFIRAAHKTVPYVIYELNILKNQKKGK